MFKLKNKEGNAYRTVKSEVKKDALVKDGWVLVEEDETPSVTADAATPPSEREAEDEAPAAVSEPEPAKDAEEKKPKTTKGKGKSKSGEDAVKE